VGSARGQVTLRNETCHWSSKYRVSKGGVKEKISYMEKCLLYRGSDLAIQ
jgi:hypothetical protein